MTEVNKRQYVHCLAKYLMVDRVAKQVEAFMEGKPFFYLGEGTGSEASGKELYLYFFSSGMLPFFLFIFTLTEQTCSIFIYYS